MKKLIYAFSLLALIFTSCSSDNNSTPAANNPTTDPSSVLLTKRTYTYSTGSTQVTNEYNYTYNGKKLVKVSLSTTKYQLYTYTGDLITQRDTYNSSNTLLETELFSYVNDKLDEYVHKIFINTYSGANNIGYRKKYVNNSNVSATYTSYSGDTVFQNTVMNTGSVTYLPNGELSTNHYVASGSTSTTDETMTFGDKNSPLKNIIGYSKIIPAIGDRVHGSFNNLVFYKNTTTNNIMVTFENGYNYAYVYGSNGFPTSSTETNLSGASVGTFQYFY